MDPLLIAVAGMLIIVACQFVAHKVRVASPPDPAGRRPGDWVPAAGGGHRDRAAHHPRDGAAAAAVLGGRAYADHGLPARDAGRRDARDSPRVPVRLRGRLRHQLAGPRDLPALGRRAGRGPVADGRGRHLDRETLGRLPPHHHGPRELRPETWTL